MSCMPGKRHGTWQWSLLIHSHLPYGKEKRSLWALSSVWGLAQTQHNVQIKKLWSDRGGEYLGGEFSDHLQKEGTIHQLTIHDTPEYNGVSERLKRTSLEKVHLMLHKSHLPRFLWGEALTHVVFTKNRTWTWSLTKTTPLEVLTETKPDLSNMHVWGLQVWVHDMSGSKLDGRAKEGWWVGFDDES